MGRILQGDFGPSLKIRDFSVAELIASGAPASMDLGIAAIALALVIGVSFGTLAALRQTTGTDFSVLSISMVVIALRNFALAPPMSPVLGSYPALLPALVGGTASLPAKSRP